jgi:(p)ppGpp synthase/HD superfamily hydrolase
MENRESFFARINPFMSPSDLRDIEIAYMMAKYAHRSQFRKELDENGQQIRYFEHLRRVAIVLLDELNIRRPEMIISALLHDSLEDTKDITQEIIEHLFGKRVVTIVKLLSKTPKEGYYDRLLKYGDCDVFTIKGCDRLDNLRSLKDTTLEFREKQILETKTKIYPMLSSLTSFQNHPTSDGFLIAKLLEGKIFNLVRELETK